MQDKFLLLEEWETKLQIFFTELGDKKLDKGGIQTISHQYVSWAYLLSLQCQAFLHEKLSSSSPKANMISLQNICKEGLKAEFALKSET